MDCESLQEVIIEIEVDEIMMRCANNLETIPFTKNNFRLFTRFKIEMS